MENEKKIKVVLLEPGKLARAVEIDASLAGMQKVVGGLIEPFYPFEEQVCIVCNEESKINGMRPNRSVKNDDGVMADFIFGPAFICDCRGENLDSLSDEQIDRYGNKSDCGSHQGGGQGYHCRRQSHHCRNKGAERCHCCGRVGCGSYHPCDLRDWADRRLLPRHLFLR